MDERTKKSRSKRLRYWTGKELRFLKENYKHMDNAELAKALNKNVESIKYQKSRQGLKGGKRKRYEYAVYQGDKQLCIGTVKECAEKLGLAEFTIRLYATPSYKKRMNGYRNPDKAMIAFRVD